MNTPMRCYSHIKVGVFDVVTSSRIVGLAFSRQKSTEKGSGCCKEIVQTQGKKVESWPKPFEPVSAWRCNPCSCPTQPPPANYDPYRIKVPDTVVPPLPPSNAKNTLQDTTIKMADTTKLTKPKDAMAPFWTMGLSKDPKCDADAKDPADINPYPVHKKVQDLFMNTTIVHPDYWKNKVEKKLPEKVNAPVPKLSYHGRAKYMYAFHEPWKPLDRLTMLAEAEKVDNETKKDVDINEKP